MDCKNLICRDCHALFNSLQNYNRHIGATGCNNGQLLGFEYVIEAKGTTIMIKDFRLVEKKPEEFIQKME